MPISVQCANCQNKYNLADALAGKKVKCRNCGAAISVPAPGVLGIEDDSLPPVPSLSGPSLDQGGSGRSCPSCGAISNNNSSMCLVCGHVYGQAAPQPTATAAKKPAAAMNLPIGLAEELATPKKRSRFQRPPGNPTLNNLDSLIRTLTLVLLVAGLVTYGIHVCMQRGSFNFAYLTPTFVALAVLVLVISPVMGFAVKFVCNAIQYPPRHDNWLRCATVLVIPFAVSLLCSAGSPENASLLALYVFSWVIAIGLWIYFFRSDAVEWVASILSSAAAGFIIWLIFGFVSPFFSNALYAEVMPMGPWSKFATGHEQTAAATKPADTQPVVETAPVVPQTPVAVTPTPTAPVEPAPVIKNGVTVVTGPTHPDLSTPKPTPEVHGPIVQATPGVDVMSDPGLQNIRDLSVNIISSPYMLIVKTGEDQSTAERWTIAPLAKKGESSFPELRSKPNEYLLNPAGTVLVTLSQFPNNQLFLSSFDSTKPPRKIALYTHKEWIGTPTLVGFIDPNHFLMRWKSGSETLQVWSCLDGTMASSKNSTMVSDDPNYWAINPNPIKGGARMAVVARGQQDIFPEIDVFHTESWQVFKQITPLQMQFNCTGLALSPDGLAVGLTAETGEGGTVMAFNLQSGDNLFTSIVPSSTFPAHSVHRFAAGINSSFLHGLVWMANNQALVVGGNTVFDAATGKKIGALGVENAVDCYNVGTNTVAILQDTSGTKNVVIAKIDLDAMKAAAGK